jgi:hypothetical protein
MADIATLEMLSDSLAGHKVSGYHYEPVQPANWADLPQEQYAYEQSSIYEFPFAVGFHDDGYDYWTDDDGVQHRSWDDFPSDVVTGLYRTRKEAEQDLAWDIHNTGAKNLWLVENYRMSGWQLRTYGAPSNWRSVPHRLVK